MKPAVFICCFLLIASITIAQRPLSWKQADDFATSYEKQVNNTTDLRHFLQDVQSRFSDSAMRVRAAYVWITSHIQYQTDDKKVKGYSSVDSVLSTKNAICAGYVNLFQFMCRTMGIPCRAINGFGRTGYENMLLNSDSLPVNHAWCAVQLSGRWQLMDVTWASGFTDENGKRFIAARNDWYYDSPPTSFILEHFPRDTAWQLLDTPVTAEQFCHWPLIGEGFSENAIGDFTPKSGVITASDGETIHFSFKSTAIVEQVLIKSRINKKIYHLANVRKKRDDYFFDYDLSSNGRFDLQLYIIGPNSKHRVSFSADEVVYASFVYFVNSAPSSAQSSKKDLF